MQIVAENVLRIEETVPMKSQRSIIAEVPRIQSRVDTTSGVLDPSVSAPMRSLLNATNSLLAIKSDPGILS
jgi:hypothetical protein